MKFVSKVLLALALSTQASAFVPAPGKMNKSSIVEGWIGMEGMH